MNASRTRPPRLTLHDLIDLELQLQADRDRDSQELRRRDAEIGERIGARRLAEAGQDREMFLGWINAIREQTKSPQGSPGRQVKLFLEVVGLVLAVLGWSLGFGAVTGWLRMNPTEPVNAIFFWSVIVGIPILLLAVWLVAIVPPSWLRRLPGAEAAQMLLRLIARGLPIAVAWIAARISPEHRVLLARLRGTLESWSWVYGRIQFWQLISLTQIFALAYSVGAILAFVAISYGNDPAFGWKSRMLSAEELHAVVQTIALPWSGFWPAAAPTLAQIEATHYTSLAERYTETATPRGDEVDAWVYWWPFLLACLLFYGLLPRVATLTFARWRLRRALAAVRLDHGDFYKLKDRLTRPLVETQATRPETETEALPVRETQPLLPDDSPAATQPRVRRAPIPPEPPVAAEAKRAEGTAIEPTSPEPSRQPSRYVVQWAGVNLSPDDLGRLTRERLGIEPAEVYTVGDLQGKGDARTLAALENNGQGEVLMVVESWEPPIADYVDFLSDLREAVGRERMIVVLLYNRDPDGRPCPPRERDVQVWRDQIATLGDPWVCVEELVETAGSSNG